MITVMPWGKFKGTPLDQIPLGYFAWQFEQWEREPLRDQALADAMTAAFLRRLGTVPGARETLQRMTQASTPTVVHTTRVYMLDRHMLAADDLATLSEMVQAGYKRLAMDAHPDRGGTHEDMVRLNRVKGVYDEAFER
jgi:hypothetical protein